MPVVLSALQDSVHGELPALPQVRLQGILLVAVRGPDRQPKQVRYSRAQTDNRIAALINSCVRLRRSLPPEAVAADRHIAASMASLLDASEALSPE